MTHTEHDELRVGLTRLADPVEVPEPGNLDASQAWARGRRWGRRRRAMAGASAALCVVVLGAVTWAIPASFPSAEEAAPASRAEGATKIPTRLWDTPSRAPEIGWGVPVVSAQEAPRWGWFGSEPGVAVRTGDGRQGFVVADDYAGGVTVSPDGRKIAYWITGETSGTPNTEWGQSMVVTGIAVRDVVDGSLRTHDFASPHGVRTSTLYFAADALLVAESGAWRAGDDGDDMARSSSEVGQGLVWDVSSAAEATPWAELFADDGAVPDASLSWAQDGRVVTLGEEHRGGVKPYRPVEEYDVRTGEVRELSRLFGERSMGSSGTPMLTASDDGWLYVVGDGVRTQGPNSITVSPLEALENTVLRNTRVLKDSDGTFGFFGVRDGAVLVSRIDEAEQMGTGETMQDVVALSDEAEETTLEVLVDVVASGDDEVGRWTWATSLLESAPVVEAAAPETSTSPWVWIGLGGGALLAGGLGLLVWWRRAQP